MVENKNVTHLTWIEFDMAIGYLAVAIRRSKISLSNIYGIPRGGLVVAVALSHRLELPVITQDEIDLKTLIADDISDSGSTLEAFSCYTIATIHMVRTTRVKPTFFVWYRDSDWVVYPWERA